MGKTLIIFQFTIRVDLLLMGLVQEENCDFEILYSSVYNYGSSLQVGKIDILFHC